MEKKRKRDILVKGRKRKWGIILVMEKREREREY